MSDALTLPRRRRAGGRVRRSRDVLRLGRFLRVGHLYRCRADRSVWWVRSIYRADAAVLLISPDGDRLVLSLESLREGWVWIATTNPAGFLTHRAETSA